MKSGRFFRSANHSLISDGDFERLATMNIGAIVDLRRPDERTRQPSRRWPGFDGVVVENHDIAEGEETWDGFMATWDMSLESYRTYLTRYYEQAPHVPRLIDLFRRYFETLATSEGALVVHCAAGKDRTGLIVALTHELAGVHRDDIIEDYLLTNDPERFNAFGAQWADNIRAERGRAPTLDTMRGVMGVEAGYLDAAKRAAIEKRLFE